MRAQALLVGLILSLLAVSCGKEQHRKNTSDPNPVLPVDKVTLVLFAAPWCTSCKSKLPELQSLIDAQPKSVRDNLNVLFYVTTGPSSDEFPTQEVAETYRDHLGVKGTAAADPWRWTNFKKQIGKKLDVPAAAILNAKGEKLKTFTSCDTCFVPREISDFIISQIKVK